MIKSFFHKSLISSINIRNYSLFKMPLKNYSELEPLSNPTEESKRLSAYKAVDENFPKNAKVIGIGSGSTVIYVAERISQLDNKDEFICIPTGFQSKNLIVDNGLRLGAIEQFPELDIAFDGADEIDTQVNAIKGGGACLFQEKLVAYSAKKFILVADYRKKSPNFLGVEWVKGIPIEVVPISYIHIQKELQKLGAQIISLRQGGSSKAGPIITDNMNFIIDAHFGPIKDPESLHYKIKNLTGVVDTGLFINCADKAYFGEQDGSVVVRTKNGDTTTH